MGTYALGITQQTQIENAAQFFARALELSRLRARADQQTLRDIGVAGVAEAHEGTLRQVGFHDDVGDNTGADVLGLLAHLLHDPGSLDHLSEARIVLDVGGDGHLPAGLQALNQQGAQIRAGRVNGGGVTGRT